MFFSYIPSFIHSSLPLFTAQTFMSCYILETVLGAGDGLVNKQFQLSVTSVITEASTACWGNA